MPTPIDENELSLKEFVKLPTTVDFNMLNTDRFKRFVAENPYIKVGTELASGYVVAYTNQENIPKLFNQLGRDFFGFYPRILSPLDAQANEAAGISQVLHQPYLDLSGKDVIIGFVDTGIDYTKDVFINEDNTSKILSIWDQTIEGDRPDNLYFGSVYTQEQINKALHSPTPLEIVPTTDDDGHGTFLASVAAGKVTNRYSGAAPGADIIVVKLKRARQFYIDKFLLPQDYPNLYESSDYMLGLKYIFDQSELLNKPIVMCIGMGSNFSSHDGNTLMEDYISFAAQRTGYAFVTAGGNESNAGHHTQGILKKSGATDTISIKIGVENTSFIVSIYAAAFDKISAGITSPTGGVITRIPYKIGFEYSEELLFEKTTISIGYYKDFNNVIIIEFRDAKQGIWEINLFGDSIISGEYYAWLPITHQVSPYVEFLRPVPEYTIVSPATAVRSITCGAYDNRNNSLYVSSSWGPTRIPRMAPDFVAPGVNVSGIYPSGPGTLTGTSVSAAITAGAAAILFEWGIIKGNLPSMDGDIIRNILISGCKRDEGIAYPNAKWGYGRLDLFASFTAIQGSDVNYNK